MSVVVFLDKPVTEWGDTIECDDVRVLGNVLSASPTDSSRQILVPLRNVLGMEGDEVTQTVEELASPGGQYTELVTDVS